MKKVKRVPVGFGDVVERWARRLGVKAVIKRISKVAGRDCGCPKRRDKLNRWIPFRRRQRGVQPDQD